MAITKLHDNDETTVHSTALNLTDTTRLAYEFYMTRSITNKNYRIETRLS